MARMDNAECLFISATARQNVDGLRRMLYQRVKAIHLERYPYESDLLYKDEYLEGKGEDAVAP